MEKPLNEDHALEQFKVLYQQYAHVLMLYASRYVSDQTAEDLVHDIFHKIWYKKTFLYLNGGMKTYLFRSVRHACLDSLKHEDVKNNYTETVVLRLKIEELYYNDDPKHLYVEDDRLVAVHKAIDKLPERCRHIFTMSYLEERKTGEIALLLNLSKRTVEVQLYKALKILRNALLLFTLFLNFIN